MFRLLNISVLTILLQILHGSYGASTGSTGSEVADPQVAVLCEAGATYHPQYLVGGRWSPDLATKPRACLKDKMDILDYCKKTYPTRDITNIVEASHYVKVSNWCKLGASNPAKCKVSRWVKPFRCLEGPFQSDALLVPESCVFDHIHNQTRCWAFSRWNATAGRACAQRGLRLRTFAMLLPCGISLFSGVEFVCCPKHFKDNAKMHKPMDVGVPVKPGSEDMLAAAAAAVDEPDDLLDDDMLEDDDDDTLNLNDDDDDDDDTSDDDMDEDEDMDLKNEDGDDDDYTEDDSNLDKWPHVDATMAAPVTLVPTTPSTTTVQVSPSTSDPYFSHFDPRTEHQSYKDAQQRLEDNHREKITSVMREWGTLEERYQQMAAADPAGAQSFRQHMTAKFQANVQALEEGAVSERRRLAALHQQRVLAHLAQRRRAASLCLYTALQDDTPNSHRVQKCIQRLARAVSAERAGAVASWRRALAAGSEAALAERPRVADRLRDADRTLQKALASLRKRPHLYNKIGTSVEDYIQSLQSKDEGGVSILASKPESESQLLDRIAEEAHRAQRSRELLHDQQQQRLQQRDDISRERNKGAAGVKETEELDDEVSEEKTTSPSPSPTTSTASPQLTRDTTANVKPDATIQEWVTVATSAPSLSGQEERDQGTVSVSAVTTPVTTAPLVAADDDEVATRDATDGDDVATHDAGDDDDVLDEDDDEPRGPVAHALRHDVPSFAMHVDTKGGEKGYEYGEAASTGSSGALYPALSLGFAALVGACAVALAVARRRSQAQPAHGFVQVEQSAGVAPTPEERHVANMQINGYENPTYKYFEVKE